MKSSMPMRRTKIFFVTFLCLSSLSVFLPGSDRKPQAKASLEIGGDSLSRRFFRPTFEFIFPTGRDHFYFRIDYLQRQNRRLEGEVDFWLTAGFHKNLAQKWSLFVELDHLCRHLTSKYNPEVFDINETVAGLSFNTKDFTFKLSGGPYIGKNPDYRYLFTSGINWIRILQSEFSLDTEVKSINASRFLYHVELACSVHPGMDLFLRRERQYEYPDMTYLGFRIKSLSRVPGSIDKLSSRINAVVLDHKHKVAVDNDFVLSLYQKNKKRLLLKITARIPVLETENFLGPFKPDTITYPVTLEYEKQLFDNLRFLIYGRYINSMPVDTDLPYTEYLGAGIGFRNQAYFDRLDKTFRIQGRGGLNFFKDKFIELKTGLNTVSDPYNFGAETHIQLFGEILTARIETFLEFGSTVKMRPLVSLEQKWDLSGMNAQTRLFAGIHLLKWF
jgi:hypothetical protein